MHLVVVYEHVGSLCAGQGVGTCEQKAHGHRRRLRLQDAAGEVQHVLQQGVRIGLLAGDKPAIVVIGAPGQLRPVAVEELEHLAQAPLLQAAYLHVLQDEAKFHRRDEVSGAPAEGAALLAGEQPRGHIAGAGDLDGACALANGLDQTCGQDAGRIRRGCQHQHVLRCYAIFQKRRRARDECGGFSAADAALDKSRGRGGGKFQRHSLPLFRKGTCASCLSPSTGLGRQADGERPRRAIFPGRGVAKTRAPLASQEG